ncbi:MAG: hypothetical protein R3E08_05665 [Thiotrichaceae bacterium]
MVYTLPANTLDTNNPADCLSKTATAKTVTVNNDSQAVDFGVVKMPFVKACVYEDVPSSAVPAKDGGAAYYSPSQGQTYARKDGVLVVYVKKVRNLVEPTTSEI